MKKNNNKVLGWLPYLIVLVAMMSLFGMNNLTGNKTVTYQTLTKIVETKKISDASLTIGTNTTSVRGVYEESGHQVTFTGTIPSTSDQIENMITELSDANVTVVDADASNVFINTLVNLVPFLLMIGLAVWMINKMSGAQSANGKAFEFSKSRARLEGKVKVRFADVAGCDEEKQEMAEIIDYLKYPKKFEKMGARIPKGVLLAGHPGTGKTLLAKAVAGEANVPFYSISGSDFVEMFVGVGASRVRDLFENAKKNAPSIIFIDEIDAVGRRRGNGMGGGHDEREQTLNQLLVEMDGFEGDEGVIVMAATNRSDVLDPALLRPGRFDRKILVGRPDVKGREAILKVHAKNKPLAKDVDLKIIAKQTPGFVGADLANLLNEAALLAARRNKKEIDASDVDEAEDRVIAGPAKRDRVISKKERETVAFHEAGHTIVGLVLNDARVVHKVTIVPRGRAGGYAIMLPKEDQMLLSKKDLKEQIAGLMGGRAAEELIFNQQSSGASNDFQQATQLARSMVTEYGMSEKLGPVQYEGQSGMFAGDYVPGQQPFSIDTSNAIDSEVKALCEEGMATAKKIIEEHKEQHRIIAEALLEYETLDERQILSLYKTGKMPAQAEDEFPSEKAATFEEAKEALIRKDAVKQEESHRDELKDEFPSEENLKQADSEDSNKSENETNEPKNDDDKDE